MPETIKPTVKECFQLTSLPQPTPCFKEAGNTPCEGEGCPVIDRINELRMQHIKIDDLWKNLLSHSACRISSLSTDNKEFTERVRKIPNRI